MAGKKVKMNIHEAVTTVVGGGRSGWSSVDRKTLKRVREALKSGNWAIVPALDSAMEK